MVSAFVFCGDQAQRADALALLVFLEQINLVFLERRGDRLRLRLFRRGWKATQELAVSGQLLYVRSLDHPSRAVAAGRASGQFAANGEFRRLFRRNRQAPQELAVGGELLDFALLDHPSRPVAPRRGGARFAIRFRIRIFKGH